MQEGHHDAQALRPQSRRVLPGAPTRDRGQQQMLGRKAGSIREWESSQLRLPPREVRRQQKAKPCMSRASEPLERVPSSHGTKHTLKDKSMKTLKMAPASTGPFGLHWSHTHKAGPATGSEMKHGCGSHLSPGQADRGLPGCPPFRLIPALRAAEMQSAHFHSLGLRALCLFPPQMVFLLLGSHQACGFFKFCHSF